MKLRKLRLGVMLACAVGNANAITIDPNITIKLLGLNDFHGQVQSPGNFTVTPRGGGNPAVVTPAGGIDQIAGVIAKFKALNPTTTVVSAGDLIGATPLVSALFHDEGTIETMNRAGLEFNAVGNHEFDEGKNELKRLQVGGCHPTDINSCQGAQVGTSVPFEGAKFKFLAANVVDTATNKTLFPLTRSKRMATCGSPSSA